MIEFINDLRGRNEILFYFGLINFVLAGLFIVLSWVTNIEVSGTNAWNKPTKFALSIGIYCLTMGLFISYLPKSSMQNIVSWLLVVLLGFEIIYIGIQAGRGQLSHFNTTTPLYSAMYSLMAFAATSVSLITLFITFKFFQTSFSELPDYYVWAIRLGLVLFVIFSFEGFVMGANLSHSIGGDGTGKLIPFLNWSREYGDPRVAHFIGMHALQILPLAAYYILKDVRLTIGLAVLYTLLAVYVLIQALWGKPLVR